MQYKETDLDYEVKHIPLTFEEKALEEEGRISGYGSIYGNTDLGGDVVEAGAFKSNTRPPKMLWQHDPGEVIGIWDSVTEDSKGLKVSGKLLLDIQRAKETKSLLKAGAIDGLSIGYRATEVDYKNTPKGMVRHIKSAELYEISVVTFPMNPKAIVTDVKQLQSPREIEGILRSAGVPSAFAKLVAIHGFAEAKTRLAKDQRDADEAGDRVQSGMTALLSEIQSLKEQINGKG